MKVRILSMGPFFLDKRKFICYNSKVDDFEKYKADSKRTDYIPLNECKKGFLYEIHSRNLDFGVFDGNDGFIGIREKFGKRYLFTEYHWETERWTVLS